MSTRQAIQALDSQLGALLKQRESAQDIAERFGASRDDPAGFVRTVLGVQPEPYQAEVLASCARSPRVAWRAAHRTGKTATLAWILMWWLLTRPFSRVLVLAPAFERQVGRYLLPEVKKWLRTAPEPLPVLVRANTVEIVGHERDWFALGVQASDPTMVEGGHAESLCVLADEAKGLDADVIAALHGTQTDPGGPSGPFYDTLRRGGKLWALHHTAATDSGLVSPAWVEERAEEWGPGSKLYISRVRGDFPELDEGTLLKLSDLEAAVGRTFQLPEGQEARIAFGVDVARCGGDASALAVWRGRVLESVEVRRGLDTMAVSSWIASEINRQKPSRVRVDFIGLGGGVVDRLRQLGHRQVEGVNVARRSSRPALYRNARAEMAWLFRTALEKGEIGLPEDPELLAELSSLRYTYDAAGRIILEEKSETKKRVGHSPDRADACLLGHVGGRAGWVGRDLTGFLGLNARLTKRALGPARPLYERRG